MDGVAPAGAAPGLVFRPWGAFEVLRESADWTVKKLIVNPGGLLSLQKHKLRDEVWTVVQGQASVTLDGEAHFLKVGETLSIARGQVHRVGNFQHRTLVIIEVQLGICREDDIERLEDRYGRCPASSE